MIGYKVVWETMIGCRSDEPVSVVVSGHALAIYSKRRFVSAPRWLAKRGYHLTVFASLAHARAFCATCSQPGPALWAVRVRGMHRPQVPMKLPMFVRESDIDSSFYNANGGWPQGTMMATDVKLLSRLPYPEHWQARWLQLKLRGLR